MTPDFVAGMSTVPSDWDGWLLANFAAISQPALFRAVLTTGQSLSIGFNQLHFNSILEDPYGGWSAVATGSQAAFSWLAPWTGFYEVTVSPVIAAVAAGLEASMLLSSSTRYELGASGTSSTVPGGICGSMIVPLNGGLDFVQGEAWVSAAVSLVSGVPSEYTSMEICFVST